MGVRGRVSGWLKLRPQSQPTFGRYWPFLAFAVALLLGLFSLDAYTPKTFTFSFMTLSVFPLVAGAWLLPARPLALLVAAVILLDAVLGSIGELEWYRVAGQGATALLIAWVGRQAAVNAAAVESSRERELAFLLDTARSLQPAAGLAGVASELVKATSTFLGENWPVELFRIRGDEVELMAGGAGAHLELDGAVAELVAAGQAVSDPAPGIVALLPINAGGGLSYVLLARGDTPGALPRDRLRLLDGVAEIARLALADAGKIEAERARARTFETLHEFAVNAAQADGPEEVARLLVDQTVKLLSKSRAAIAWRNTPGEPLRLMASTVPTSRLLLDGREGAAATALREQRTLVLTSARDEDISALWEEPLGTVLVAPLLVRGIGKGVLMIATDISPTDEEVLGISLLTSQTTPILNDAHLRQELQRSELRYRSLYRSFGCGILVYGPSGRLQESNWAAQDMLGLSQAEIEQHPPFGSGWKLVSPDGREIPDSMRPPGNVVRSRRPVRNLVAKATGPSDRVQWLRIDCSPVEEGSELKIVITTFFPVAPPD